MTSDVTPPYKDTTALSKHHQTKAVGFERARLS